MGSSTDQVTAFDVAKYFLHKANTEGDLITNLKMQKLLYYAQAWYLVNYKTTLFKDKIKAWDLGPVVHVVYSQYKKFSGSPIVYNNTGKEADKFTQKQIDYLNECYSVFIKFAAHQLVNMSHNEPPWKEARENGQCEISTESMRKYYTKLLKQSKQ